MSKFHLLINRTMDNTFLHPLLFPSLVSIFFIFFVAKLFKKIPGNKNSPPSPRKLPFLGNLHQLGTFPHHTLQSMAKKHGPVMLLQLGKLPTVVVSSVPAAREVMKTHDVTFADRPNTRLNRRLVYDNKDISLAPYGEYWRQLKSVCVLQLLSNRRVQSFHFIREEETELLMEKIRGSSVPVNLSEMFTQLTNDVVCRSSFGRKYSEGDEGKKFLSLLKEFLELLGTINIWDIVPCLSWMNRVKGFDARVDRVARELDEFLEEVIGEREKSPAEQSRNGENFLDILLDINKNSSAGVPIERDSIKAIILDVFGGGTDTTATVLEWAMTELLRHPEILKKLQKEVREVVKDKRVITEKDLEQMPYLKAVIKETLRFHTPIPLLVPRVARKDARIMGYDVSAGTMVMINAWAIARDPAYWDEPEKFRPERFLNSSIDYKGLNFELIPFGAGRRGCPGISFAIATNEFVLANLVKNFDWRLPDGGKDLDMSARAGVGISSRKAVPLFAVGTQHQS